MKLNHAAGAVQALRSALRRARTKEEADQISSDLETVLRAARLASPKPGTLLAELVKATPEEKS